MSELPLFPLQTVLLQEGRLALRIFEPRYLDMVAQCLRGANRFGVVAIEEGAEVGAELPSKAGKREARAHDIATIARDGQQANTHRAFRFQLCALMPPES